MVGHAVRAMYMASAMADLALELGDEGLKRACEALWRDVTTAQMYVTAGLGPRATNEGFTEPYDLPNGTAYAETCASVALVFWAHRMLHLDLDGRYADVMELALFNGALTGLSHEGTHYFYSNPLESRGQHSRWAWHLCPCCTMNVSRLVASVAGYALSTRDDGIAFHLYGGFETTVTISGVKVAMRETSAYPWSGEVGIEIDPESAVGLRSEAAHSRMERRARPRRSTASRSALRPERGYATINRLWRSRRRGDARPADAGRAALCASERTHGRRPHGVAAWPVDLLRRGGGQSRRRRPDAGAAALGARSTPNGRSICSTAS